MHRCTAFTLCLAACAHGRPAAPPALRLDRVVLFQNGIGHFERRGGLADRHLRLVLRPHEVDDVIKTLTVIDRDGKAQQVAAVLPTPDETQRDRVVVDIELSRPVRDLIVSYAVPTAAWKTTYRVAMPEQAGGPLLPGLRDDRQPILLYQQGDEKRVWEGPAMPAGAGYRIVIRIEADGTASARHCLSPCSLE